MDEADCQVKTEVAAESLPTSLAWRNNCQLPSLPEAHRSIPILPHASWFRKILAFAGPGYLIAVGYMDPGNWASDIAGGSKFGYMLLSIVLLSNIFAVFLQALSAKLGIATGRDLAQACRDHYPRLISIPLWIICEIGIIACDLAEVLGSAVALKLLFNVPLLEGVVLTTCDVMLVLYFQGRGFRWIEAFVITLIITIALCFAYEIFLVEPDWKHIKNGLVPSLEIFHNREMLYSAIAILGATVMPHNLYLHSSIVQTRAYGKSIKERKEALRFAIMDSTIALTFAFLINAAILILGAAAFHTYGMYSIVDISEAYKLLSPVLGVSFASTIFALALLAAGQNSSLTGTLAGQIIMEGFLSIRLKPWKRRLLTRLIAIVPALFVIGLAGENKLTSLLIFSQVILSFQLPFAMFPLVQFTSERAKMGEFVNSKLTMLIAWILVMIILFFNAELLWMTLCSA